MWDVFGLSKSQLVEYKLIKALWYGFKNLLGQTQITILWGGFCLKLATFHAKLFLH